MPTQQETTDSLNHALAGTDDPGVMILSLDTVRNLSGAETVRPDVAEFIRANPAIGGDRMVQVTSTTIQFV